MASIFGNTLVASAAALTIAVGTSVVPVAAFARGKDHGFHVGFASSGLGHGGLYIERYGYDSGRDGFGWGLGRMMAAAYNLRGSYLDGDYSIYPYGSW
jgi:hypothetical protein